MKQLKVKAKQITDEKQTLKNKTLQSGTAIWYCN